MHRQVFIYSMHVHTVYIYIYREREREREREKENSFPLVVRSSTLAVVTILKKYKKLIYKMNRIEALKSSRENSMIYFSGYLYTQHRVTKEKRIFRCED